MIKITEIVAGLMLIFWLLAGTRITLCCPYLCPVLLSTIYSPCLCNLTSGVVMSLMTAYLSYASLG